jgi:HK97 gp10 family phage protein
MEISFNVSGLAECNAMLNKLPDELARKAGETAVRAGGNFLKKAVQEKAPKGKGHLAKSIKIRKRRTAAGLVGFTLAVMSPHAHLVEWGTKAHKIVAGKKGRSGAKTGKKALSDGSLIYGAEVDHPGAQAHPFVRPAIDENQEAYLNKLREVLARAIMSNAFKFTGRKR